MLRGAIAKTGNTALAAHRDFAARAYYRYAPDGRRADGATLYEERDLNSSKELFDGLAGIKTEPEMVQLASQLVQRQSGKYDAADLEDRYETRLRAMIEAKLKGEGIDAGRTGRAGSHERGRSDGGAEEEPWSGGRRREAGTGEEKAAASFYRDVSGKSEKKRLSLIEWQYRVA